MRRRAIYVLAIAVLFPIFEKAGVVCHQHGSARAGIWLVWAADILKLALFVLLLGLLIAVSRQTMKRRTLCVLAVALLFPVLQKAGIECSQHGLAVTGSCLTSAANILKPTFLILLIAFLALVSHLHPSPFVQAPLAFLFGAMFFLSCGMTVISGRLILNVSRPAWPGTFTRDQAGVGELTDLANEMIQRQRITWVGNSEYRFVFAIRHGDAEYQFASTFVARNHDFRSPVDAEDMSKVHHFDSPFLNNALRPTDKVLLDPNDYAFCQQASETIRRIGFDNVMLYPEHNVVQFQIYNFIGWDNGWRYVYYFSPSGALPTNFTYDRQLNANWYYAQKRRFSDEAYPISKTLRANPRNVLHGVPVE